MSELAIDGGTPVRTARFPAWPVWGSEEEAALLRVLRSGAWGSTSGEEVHGFEREFATFQGVARGVAVANATLGLAAALRAVGVGPGDEVIVPPYTFIASASAVVLAGGVPVFADVDPATLLLDPADVERAAGPRTRAVMCVHLAGGCCDMDALGETCRRHGLRLVEDAAQAHGARWRGRGCGSLGDAGVFSFQSSKNLNAGEGGMIVSDDAGVAAAAWSLANVGRVPDGGWYQHELIGWNLRMTEFQGALLRAQLRRLPAQMEVRERNARLLTEMVAAVPGVEVAAPDARASAHGRHLFPFRVRDAALTAGKEAVVAALAAEGIPCAAGYTALHRNRALLDAAAAQARAPYRPRPCPGAETAEAEVVWLPKRVLLGEPQDMEEVAVAIEKVTSRLGARG